MITARKALNEPLFHLLRAKFGKVFVANAGEVAMRSAGTKTNGRVGSVIRGGEHYKVNCPVCGDTRHRLWVSYLYGTDDPMTGYRMLHLAYCYNERCRQDMLWDFLKQDHFDNFRKVPDHAKAVEETDIETLKPVSLPAGQKAALTQLPEGHVALEYLRARGYDPAFLWKHYRVMYYEGAEHAYVTRRLVFPVFASLQGSLEMVGWQTRSIPNWSARDLPKYFTMAGFPKSRVLYNLHQAHKEKTIVLCEGVLDAIRLHPYGACLFGKTISITQIRILQLQAPKAKLVVMLDSDAESEARRIQEQIQHYRACNRLQGSGATTVGRVTLPSGDPGDHSPDELRELIREVK